MCRRDGERSKGCVTQLISTQGPQTETGPFIHDNMNFNFEGNESWYYSIGDLMYYYDYYGDSMNLSGNYSTNFQQKLSSLGKSTIYFTFL